jgi:hypothetical protein
MRGGGLCATPLLGRDQTRVGLRVSGPWGRWSIPECVNVSEQQKE